MNLPSAEEIKKLPPDGGAEFNRLIFEQSPYLLQHARNPVDWYPWGQEAFQKAKAEDKPIFLSIGYSTCHWCHVMEHESFEDSAVAALMNERFVSIKVDREERPDIDQMYMSVTQAMTGQGGWPMTVMMTWDRKPFFAGTYFPKESRYGRNGMLDLLPAIAQAWATRREEIVATADNITTALRDAMQWKAAAFDPDAVVRSAYEQLVSQFDSVHGGFGGAPKFPTPHNLIFLLRYRQGEAMRMVEKTLTEMRRGGVYDHVGFGFHRYSTDSRWFLPHFEKMLYDQALLALAYAEAFAATGKTEYRQTLDEVLDYVLRDMTDEAGGFYSAEDADSEGEEGKFYVWKESELDDVLGKRARMWKEVFHVRPDGNYFEEATRQATGENILFMDKDMDVLASTLGMAEEELRVELETARVLLFERRVHRVPPLRDDKVLTDWNGLMIAALARAAQVTENRRYLQAAGRAADFVLTKLRTQDGRLVKRYRNGESGLPAHLDDYAMVTWGLIELYEAGLEIRHLEEAVRLQELTIAEFWDSTSGGFFFSTSGETIIAIKELYDGATPSGNSVAAMNLLRLSRMTGRADWEEKSAAIGRVFSKNLTGAPMAHTHYLQTLLFHPSREIVVVGEPDASADMIRAIRRNAGPHHVILLKTAANAEALTRLAPFTEGQSMQDGKTTVYVCENFACRAPTTNVKKVIDLLKR